MSALYLSDLHRYGVDFAADLRPLDRLMLDPISMQRYLRHRTASHVKRDLFRRDLGRKSSQRTHLLFRHRDNALRRFQMSRLTEEVHQI